MKCAHAFFKFSKKLGTLNIWSFSGKRSFALKVKVLEFPKIEYTFEVCSRVTKLI